MKTLIRQLTEISGPSGHENKIRETIHSLASPLADKVWVDSLGNLIAQKYPSDPGLPHLLLAAHMDEIGFIISHIDDAGFIRFQPVGGVNPQMCTGARVRFLNGVAGMIGVELLRDLRKLPTFEQMYIDIGYTGRKDFPLRIGDMAVFEGPYQEMGNRLVSKALDDRVGVAIMLETLRQIKEQNTKLAYAVDFVFTVQEEVGERGASAAGYTLAPDLCLAIDVTVDYSTPKALRNEVCLGSGPAIKVRDAGMISDPRLVQWMAKTAENAGIPYQMEILRGGTTDARPVQISRAGVPSGCLSLPIRNVHSPSEMIDFQDIQNACRLLLALLQQTVNLKDETS